MDAIPGEILWPISQIFIDAVVLLAVGLPTPLIKKTKNVFERGFFCDDEDIMHPYIGKSTVENKYFHAAGYLINILVILSVEYLRRKDGEDVKLWRFKLPLWFYNVYYILLAFIFGTLATILVSTILKGSVGRLRPYFLTDCSPNINCSLPANRHIYHTNYECTNKKFKENSRLSFPSGHASFAMYCALFLAVFVQQRLKSSVSALFTSSIEVFSILLALYVGVSRVSDYKHHWSDVVAGFIIGGACATIVSANLYWPLRRKKTCAVGPEPDSVTSKM